MRTFSFIIALFCLCLVHADYFGTTFTAPLFMWSNSQYFTGKNVHVNEYTSIDDITNELIGQESSLEKYVEKKKSQPEVIFVFVEPELRTEQFSLLADAYSVHPNGGAFSQLKGTLESYATSSLSIPYTHVGSSKTIASSMVDGLIESLHANVILAKNSDSTLFSSLESRAGVSRMSLSQLKTVATKEWNILSNGVIDIVIVCFDSPVVHTSNVDEVALSYAADDTYIHDLLHSLGNKNYVAIFTAEKPASESLKQTRATLVGRQLAEDASLYPSEVIEAHIVMIPFLVILFTGICCTFSVQSDLKFDAERKAFKK